MLTPAETACILTNTETDEINDIRNHIVIGS